MNIENKSISDLILRCREAHDIARETSALVIRDLTAIAENAKIYTFKQRLKSPTKILSKVKRKQSEGVTLREDCRELLSGDAKDSKEIAEALREIERLEGYSPDEVTDGFGCRYVTLFQEQIPEIVAAIFERFHLFNERDTTPIKLRELVVYTNRRRDDPLSIAGPVLRAYQGSGFAKSPAAKDAVVDDDESRQNAYTSVHMIFEVNLILEQPGKGVCTEKGTFEIQIRDIFEEGWGEIDHYVRYSNKDDLDAVTNDADDGRHGSPLSRSLRSLKEAVHACGSVAQNVFVDYRAIELPKAPALETRSATSRLQDRDLIVQKFKKENTKRISIENAYSLLLKAQESSSYDEAPAIYRAAGEAFKKAIEALGKSITIKLAERDNKPISYFLKMELANCYVLGEGGAKLQDARHIFEEVKKEFPGDPVVRLRLARTIMTIEKSVDSYENAMQLLREAVALVPNDKLTGVEHWIQIALRVALSFILWQRSELARTQRQTELSNDLLRDAAISALTGYQVWAKIPEQKRGSPEYKQHAHKALSNLLYFASQIVFRNIENETINKGNIERWLEQLEAIGAPRFRDHFKTDDNVMVAYRALGRREDAVALADQIFVHLKGLAEGRAAKELNLGEIAKMLHADEREVLRSAVEVLTSGG